MAAEHIRRLRARLSAREKHAAAVRVTLEAGHIVTPKELQQVLTTIERKLDAEEAIAVRRRSSAVTSWITVWAGTGSAGLTT